LLRKALIFCISFIILFADYNNITLSQLLKKVGLLNNINIIIPSDLNSTKAYTFTINNFIKAKDLLKVSKILLNMNGYKLTKLNKSFYIVERIKDTRYKFIYKIKNSNKDIILPRISSLYPNQIFPISNKLLLIKYKTRKELYRIIRALKKVDYTSPAYYVQIRIYNTDTDALKQFGIDLINPNQGNVLLITEKQVKGNNLLPALMTLLSNKQKSTLIASPQLFLAPDKNNTAEFKEVTTIPITIRKTQIIPGTNPVVTNTNETIYKEVGLIMKLQFITATQDNRVKFLLNLNDSNIISYTENGITSSAREIKAIIQAKLNSTIFIAGLSKTKTIKKIVGIPILKDIPLIKYLFSKTEKEKQNKTLVVTIRITKVNDDLGRDTRVIRKEQR